MYSNLWALLIVWLKGLPDDWRGRGVKQIAVNVNMLRRIFPAKAIKIKTSGVVVISESGSEMTAEINGRDINIAGSISLKNCVILLRDMTLNIDKFGEKVEEKLGHKILTDGSLWVENTLFLGNLGCLSNLNIVSGGIVQGNIAKVSMLYIREGRYSGTISAIEKWLHISNSRGVFKGNIGRIGEALYLDAGELITDSLPVIDGGYVVIKDGKILKTDETPWTREAVIEHIGALRDDRELFIFGSGGSVLFGAGGTYVLCKEGTDPYSRYKTENIISSNRFYRLIDGKVCEVTLRTASNQQLIPQASKFYTYVRLEIVNKHCANC